MLKYKICMVCGEHVCPVCGKCCNPNCEKIGCCGAMMKVFDYRFLEYIEGY